MSSSINWTLQQIVSGIPARLHGISCTIHGVSTDTRTLQPGNLFIALRGPNFDGHQFVSQAIQKGAAALLVDHLLDTTVPQVIVDDTRIALGQLASAWRSQFAIPVIAITGSNGKTTVKEMIASICMQRGSVLATHGNLNNDIGMPLTLLQMNESHRFAVIEMGANHPGEIAYLTKLAKPDVAVINNAGPAHLEGFGSLAGVAAAKGEIYSGLSQNGIAVINVDDAFASVWQTLCHQLRTIHFGLEHKAEVMAQWSVNLNGSQLAIQTPQGAIQVQLQLLGRHNVMNALAATAATIAAGMELSDIKRGLEAMKSVKGRLQLKNGKQGSRIIDDTYNANPASLHAALDVLQNFPGRHFVALGDMGELGVDTDAMHHEAGVYARRTGVERLYTVGTKAHHAATGFGSQAESFEQQPAMIQELEKSLTSEVTLLVKGSRAAQMENVVNALIMKNEA